ncbi:hypothetical protein [Hyphomicrobium sp.]|uniref:hypothetical protein n=1 Tax=Hyphomicrobium sp. TaxID=82 RepID=UPI001DFBA036|nr:hypothetical protein [Hyphomicrobium sp.]MBY0559329.1 hypothetical protein [Hyphomicrobium sp.]
MKIIFRFPLTRPIELDDHWAFAALGGEFSVEVEDKLAKAFLVSIAGEPLTSAPLVEELSEGPAKLSITDRCMHKASVHSKMKRTLSYLKCMFDVELDIETVDIRYIAESDEEKDKIDLLSMGVRRQPRPLTLTYDFITRAVLAADLTSGDPDFTATLTDFARRELLDRRYIDSFRYSFMLFESLYGGGKFKSEALKGALSENEVFLGAIEMVIQKGKADRLVSEPERAFLATFNTPKSLIGELVEKRGHYFHGNLKKPSAWHPDRQEEAEALALVAMMITEKIAFTFAEPLWDDSVVRAHQQRAFEAGAKYVVHVTFTYRNRGEGFDRKGQFRMNYPATKATPTLAMRAVKDFLMTFENDAPLGAVKEVSARGVDGTLIFTMSLHVPDK